MDPSSHPSRRGQFEVLATEVYEPLQRYVRRRVDTGSVDDIVSETLTTLWRRLDDVPGDAALPWAYGIARRHIANHRRGATRHLRLVRRVEAEPRFPDDAPNPLDVELEAALAALDDADRELLRLWAWEGLTTAEIAVVLGVTPNAASIRFHRAKTRLSQNLTAPRKNAALSGHSHRERRKEERSWPTTS